MLRTIVPITVRKVWSRLASACAIGAVICAGAILADEPSDLPSRSVLKWHNGDQLAGQMLEASPQTLSWNASLFEEPLQLQVGALRSITWQYDQPAILERRGFRVETTQGNLLVGELIGCNQETLRLENDHFGVVEIPRKNVRSLVNLAGSSGRWLGPMRIEDWDADRQSKQSLINTAHGQIVFPQENLVFKKITVEEKTLIDVAFRWSGTLDMKLGFAVPKKWGKLDSPSPQNGDSNNRAPDETKDPSLVLSKLDPDLLERLPRLEMFADSMVLQQEEGFDIVFEEVDLESGFLRLVLEWDPQSKQMKAFDASGKLLATIALNPLADDFEPGIFVLNQNGRLTLDHLVMMTVAGEMNPRQEFISTKQGTLTGTVEAYDGQMWSIRRASDEALVQVSKEDFYMTHIPCTADEPAALNDPARSRNAATTVELRNGSRVSGELLGTSDNRLRLLSDAATQAIEVRLDRAQRLEFPKVSTSQPAIPQTDAGTHLLETEEGECHGWLRHAGDSSCLLLWQAVGSDKPVPLLSEGFRIRSTDPATVKRRELTEFTPPQNPLGYRDQLYLRNGDRFPANVLRVQSGQLHTEAFQRLVTFPTSDVVRCRLGVPRGTITTLDSPPWKIVAGEEPPRDQNQIFGGPIFVFNRYACHPSLLETGGFELTIRSGVNKTKAAPGVVFGAGQQSQLELRLFAKTPSDPCTRLYLTVSAMPDSTVSVNLIADPMLGDSSAFFSFPATENIVCSLRVVDSELIGSINGREAYRKRLKLSPDLTRGVVIGLHDNLPIDAIRQDDSYSVRNAFVRPDSREVALTEPRFVKQQPARSLLIGRNGDVWRADIVSMGDDSVTVRSGGRHLVVERSLVSSILWPDLPPAEEASSEPTSDQSKFTEQPGEESQGNAERTAKGDADEANTVRPEVPTAPKKAGKLAEVQLLMSDGTKLTLKLESWGNQTVVGSAPSYGRLELPTAEIVELRSGSQIAMAADHEGRQWRFKLGKDLSSEKLPPESDAGEGAPEAELVGQEAPTFNVKSLEGTDIDLADYRGKVVVLDFWATWCGYCVEELPGLVSEIGKLPPEKVQLIMLNQSEDEATIAAFLTEKGLRFPVGLDKDQVAPLYKVNGLPTTIVIDTTGKIAHVKVGAGEGPFAEMLQVVRKLAAENNDPPASSNTSSAPAQPPKEQGPTASSPPASRPEMATEETKSQPRSAQKQELVSIEAHIQAARGKQPALLVIRAKLAEAHKVFSLTQKSGGPVKTTIKLDPSDRIELGEFRALETPRRYVDPSFGQMEVEVHEGIATWYAPLALSAGVALDSLELNGQVRLQVCNQGSCFPPRDYPFTARFAPDQAEADAIDLSKSGQDE